MEKPGNWREELSEEIGELRSLLTETRAQMRAMEACIEKYRPLMEGLKTRAEFWGNFKKEMTSMILKAVVYASLGAVMLVMALGAQKWLKEWLA